MKDMLGRELAVGDFVVYYSNLYQVTALLAMAISGYGYAKIMIHPSSRSSKPVRKYSREMVQVPAADVTLHLLKNGGM